MSVLFFFTRTRSYHSTGPEFSQFRKQKQLSVGFRSCDDEVHTIYDVCRFSRNIYIVFKKSVTTQQTLFERSSSWCNFENLYSPTQQTGEILTATCTQVTTTKGTLTMKFKNCSICVTRVRGKTCFSGFDDTRTKRGGHCFWFSEQRDCFFGCHVARGLFF